MIAAYLGGSGVDAPNSIAVDSARSAHVVGMTRSPDYPTTADALQRAPGGGPGNGFVSKIAPDDEGDPDDEVGDKARNDTRR